MTRVREALIAFSSKRRSRNLSAMLQSLLDCGCITAAYFAAIRFSAVDEFVIPYSQINYLPYLFIFIFVWLLGAVDRRVLVIRSSKGLVPYLAAVTEAVGYAAVLCVFAMAFFTPEGLSRRFLAAFCLATLVFLLVFRLMERLVLQETWRLGRSLKRGVIVGANRRTQQFVDAIRDQRRYGIRLAGVLEDEPERMTILQDYDLDHLGRIDDLDRVLREGNIDDVYISLPVRSQYELIQKISVSCESVGASAHLLADLFPLRIAASRLTHINEIPLLSLSTISESHVQIAVKRFIDFIVSSVLIITLFPLFILIALTIRLDSKGTVFFTQERVGQNRRRFRMIKFRSMVHDAEALRESLEDLDEMDGPVFKIRGDPRVTRVGKFLRRFSIDEAPQIINVWRGEMSLVGPRPPLAKEVERYTWDQRRRLSVKPGMTGLWQVSGRNDLQFQEWIELDLQYIDTWSLAKDFEILLKTLGVVVSGRGAS